MRYYIIEKNIERYDYRPNESVANDILVTVEELDNRQRVALSETLHKVKLETEMDELAGHMAWFHATIIPILQEFAQNSFSLLEVEEDKGVINVCIRNNSGLCISEMDRALYVLLFLAVQICIDADENETILALTYDCSKFINYH